MKFGKKLLAILLAAAIAAGAAMVAGANDGGQIADEIHYTEAVELFSNLEIEQAKVLDVLGGSDLDGKAAQTLTYNEGVELINALHTDGRTWSRKPMDSNLTVGQFIGLVDKLLCTEEWFTGYEYYKVYLCKYMAGFEQGYEQIKDRAVSREEAVQILMNALSAKVQYGVTWFLASEYGLTWETSMDGDLTDEWNRPVRRWLQNGTPITEWHTMPALVVDDASLCTHDMLERAGLLDFSQDGGFEYNPWCMFDICANGGITWAAGKLHWNHEGGRESCYSNWLTKRPGSRLEVYYMGEGRRNIPDAGGFTDCQVYQAIIIDEYLAYCTGGNARVFVSENESWNLYDTSL